MYDIYVVLCLVKAFSFMVIILCFIFLPTFIFSFFKNVKKDSNIPFIGHILLILLLISWIYKLIFMNFNKKIKEMKKLDLYNEEKIECNNKFIKGLDKFVFYELYYRY
jgi:uncharacterized protein YqhQ